jgi:hypothetical protein
MEARMDERVRAVGEAVVDVVRLMWTARESDRECILKNIQR